MFPLRIWSKSLSSMAYRRDDTVGEAGQAPRQEFLCLFVKHIYTLDVNSQVTHTPRNFNPYLFG